jgi:hypothetical protein
MEIPRCMAIGFLNNLQNNTFNEIQAIDQNQLENEVPKDKRTPVPIPNEDKQKFSE